MQLIISEKAIAGERIASLLADGKVSQNTVLGARVFDFDWQGKETRVIPLRGHISDVEFPKEYSSWVGVPLQNLINAPIIYSRKEFRIIDCIKNSALDANKIIIATDADREGESIGLEAINYALMGNKNIQVERAYFSAISKEDITKSFASLEKFDYNFAHSANARREIDLIWGAALTRFLSITSGQMGKSFLSVGRVQTPTLALIVQREAERKNFKTNTYWEISADLKKDETFSAMHKEDKFWDKEKAQKIIDKNISKLFVINVDKRTKNLKRPEPFNTTEFLRAAANTGISASKAMNLAESLYQKGFTSYPRTDNKAYPKTLNLKDLVNKLSVVPELKKDVMKVLSLEKIVPSKGKETKDHPPIYPVLGVEKSRLSEDEWKIYKLICKRFLATLYIDAKTGNVAVVMEGKDEQFVSRGQIIIEPGWKSIYTYSKLKETFLPELKKGDEVDVLKMDLNEKETQPPSHYSQASLIKLMEKHNLGTKSTRPNIIQKLYSRNYISGNKSIQASDVAFAVINSLNSSCEIVTKPEMTANLEKEMDEIAAGKKTQKIVVENSSKKLISIVDILSKEKEKIRAEIKKSIHDKNSLGICDKCKEGNLVIRKGKSGKRFAGCSAYPKCTNTYPLPQKGIITPTQKNCVKCPAPVIKVKKGKFTYEMCLNMNCKTKDAWKKPVKK